MKTKQTIKLNESQLRQMVKNSLNEFINGIRPNTRPEHPKFSVSNLAYEIQNTLEILQDKGEHLDNLLAQASSEMFGSIGSEIQRFGADTMGKAASFLQQFQGDNYINESKLRNIIKETVKKVLNENLANTYRDIEGTSVVKNHETGKDEIYFEGNKVSIDDFEGYLKYCFEDFVKHEIDSEKENFRIETGVPVELNKQCYEAWIKWLGTNVLKTLLVDLTTHRDDELNESKTDMSIMDTIQYLLNKYGHSEGASDRGLSKELLEFAGIEATPERIEYLCHKPTHDCVRALRKILNAPEQSRGKVAKREIMAIW